MLFTKQKSNDMDLKKIGKLIAESRKEAGYTQKSLADVLFVTDKAVSKWERGLSIPDSTILPKLSMLLDIDMEHLIPNQLYEKSDDWYGLLVLDDKIDISTMIYDKPLINYLISYFMLVGITNIAIKHQDIEYIKSFRLDKYGINIIDEKNIIGKKVMVLYDRVLFFGANVTRLFKSYMNQENDVKILVNKKELPFIFVHDYDMDISKKKIDAELKIIGRGMINISINTKKEINDASKFIEIYQRTTKIKIADLDEIYLNRSFNNR